MAGLRDLRVSPRRVVPARWLRMRAVRSSGPGGQNVNKVATRVELALDLDGVADAISPSAAERVALKLRRRLDAEGRLVVVCGRTRHRARNQEIALQRMEELLREALHRERVRKPTRPTRASQARRVDAKKRRSSTKQLRRKPADD